MKLCVILPALNEEATIQEVIRRIPREIDGIDEMEIAVIDDGSTDKTAELARAAGATVISHGRNCGVGAAFQTGVEHALSVRTDFMVNMDADGQFDPRDIHKLIHPLVTGQADCATASRFRNKEYIPIMPKIKFYGNLFMSRLVTVLIKKRFYDVSCGFRAYTKDCLMSLNLFGHFTYTHEVILDLCYKGFEIQEIPVRVRGTRKFGKSRVASNLFTYGINTSKIIFRTFRDYRPMLVFGGLAAVLIFLSFALGCFLMIHYIQAGQFTPHKWAGVGSAILLALGTLIFVTGLLADMLGRLRVTQERVLFHLRKRDFQSEGSFSRKG